MIKFRKLNVFSIVLTLGIGSSSVAVAEPMRGGYRNSIVVSAACPTRVAAGAPYRSTVPQRLAERHTAVASRTIGYRGTVAVPSPDACKPSWHEAPVVGRVLRVIARGEIVASTNE